jgi:hypothetical protein
MTLRQYLILMTFCTIVSWAVWGTVISLVDPSTGGIIGILFFYTSLGLALVGTNSIVGLLIRSKFNRTELISRLAAISFRQALWFSLVIILAMVLQSYRMLTWWIMAIVVLVLVITEFFFLSLKRRV